MLNLVLEFDTFIFFPISKIHNSFFSHVQVFGYFSGGATAVSRSCAVLKKGSGVSLDLSTCSSGSGTEKSLRAVCSTHRHHCPPSQRSVLTSSAVFTRADYCNVVVNISMFGLVRVQNLQFGEKQIQSWSALLWFYFPQHWMESYSFNICSLPRPCTAQHFASSAMTLNERFTVYQRRAAEKEMTKPRKSPEIHR